MSQEEEILGKAYDSRLMARLLKYLRPYSWQVAIALISILLKSFADVLGPYLTKVAIDRYLAPAKNSSAGFWNWLSPRASYRHCADRGDLCWTAGLQLPARVSANLLHAVDRTESDVRSSAARSFAICSGMHVAFYDKNPVGRLVTRVTTDVDALNEMFTSGVVSIFEDLFVLFGILGVMLCMNWKLALITFAVLPFIVYATKIFRDQRARFLPAYSRCHCTHQFVSAGTR